MVATVRIESNATTSSEELGRADAVDAHFRTAAQMVALWEGLDLPAWLAPYALRDTHLGYLTGYSETSTSRKLSEEQASRAAQARWGQGWRKKLAAAHERT